MELMNMDNDNDLDEEKEYWEHTTTTISILRYAMRGG